MAHSVVAGDPSLRLQNGYAQDDAIDDRRCHQKFKLTHYQGLNSLFKVAPEMIGYKILIWAEERTGLEIDNFSLPL